MDASIIQADYDELERVARLFEEQATKTAEMNRRLHASVEQLERGGWLGQGSQAFYREMGDNVLPGVERLTNALEEAGIQTKQISDLIRTAEEEAASIFKGGLVAMILGGLLRGALATGQSRGQTDRRTDRRVTTDRLARQPEGGYRGGHFDTDWAGRSILERYLLGGEDWNINNDPNWTRYMKGNEILQGKLRGHVENLALDLYRNGKTSSPIDQTFAMKIENGESIVGYQYLHGTNANAGGFQMNGNTKIRPDGTGYVVEMDLSYTWNDIIDPNPEYQTDNWKSRIAEIGTLGRADPYEIHITWSEKTKVRLDANGNIISVEGWPG
jgi:WXG100 family type VII secretion target